MSADKPNKLISSKTAYKEYNQADKIIRYLINPNEPTELTATEQKNLDVCKKIHKFRYNFMRKTEVVAMIMATEDVGERQAYNLINLTEEIFGKAEAVHKDYERNFLLECSRKNIELAMKGRNSIQISKALMAHYKISGLDEFVPDMPDFSKLEQHEYLINLPGNVLDYLKMFLKSGAVKMSDILPPPNINLHATDAEIVE
jgi:hypothetical protein